MSNEKCKIDAFIPTGWEPTGMIKLPSIGEYWLGADEKGEPKVCSYYVNYPVVILQKYRWMPDIMNTYYYVNEKMEVCSDRYDDTQRSCEKMESLFKAGNLFKTEKMAEIAREKLSYVFQNLFCNQIDF